MLASGLAAGRACVDPLHQTLDLAELISALSHALDITEGQPAGHCIRCAWIGSHIGRQLHLSASDAWSLYYTLLLKDLGCSSNAARICELYLTDDLRFKHDFKTVGVGLPGVLNFVLAHTGLGAPLAARFRALLGILHNGDRIAQELITTRCERGADIARKLRFPDAVAHGIFSLDEHWDGSGRPDGRSGTEIPLNARIALLAQVIDVFHTEGGRDAALAEVRARRGRWFDPELVDVVTALADDEPFWQMLTSPALEAAVVASEPDGPTAGTLDDDYLDDIAAAFGQVIDAKSPYTSGHSSRVALYTDLLAEQFGLDAGTRRWLKRGALLHDVGKLGVSNAILDKPGKLSDEEWVAMRAHAEHSEAILSRIAAWRELARVAAAHHERLDGRGYPRGIAAADICLETRLITTADIFDAITAERPYRPAVPLGRTLEIMAGNVGTALDADCFAALETVVRDITGVTELASA